MTTMFRRTTMLLTGVLLLGGCASLPGQDTGRLPGPYDPGRSSIPVEAEVVALCGKRVARLLYTVSDKYVVLATEWERYQVYATETDPDGTTAEELDGLEERRSNITSAIRRYRTASRSLRRAAADVEGVDAAECDRAVVAPYEAEYGRREEEINYVDTESLDILTGRGGEE
jgi:hypothetical protein